MGVVQVRIEDEDLKRIDLLVKRQGLGSRDEVIGKMIKTCLSESMFDDQDVDRLVRSLLKLNKAGKEPLVLRLNQTATAIVVQRKSSLAYADTGVHIATYAPKDPMRSAGTCCGTFKFNCFNCNY